MNTAEVKRIIEAALLCAQQPMPVAELRRLFADEVEVGADTVRALLDELRGEWSGRGVELVALATGWRFQTTPDIARFVAKLHPERPPKYSRAVLETLAIIAYRQPVTRGDIEEIRGVTVSAQIVKTLEDRGWIEVIGHKEVVGRPALFATTKQFLDDLGLRSIQELPSLDVQAAPAEAFGQLPIPDEEADAARSVVATTVGIGMQADGVAVEAVDADAIAGPPGSESGRSLPAADGVLPEPPTSDELRPAEPSAPAGAQPASAEPGQSPERSASSPSPRSANDFQPDT